MQKLLYGIYLIIESIILIFVTWKLPPLYIVGFFLLFVGTVMSIIGASDIQDELKKMERRLEHIERQLEQIERKENEK